MLAQAMQHGLAPPAPYLFKRQGDREETVCPSAGSLPGACKGRVGPGTQVGSRDPTTQATTCPLPECTLPKSWNWEWKRDLNAGTPIEDAGVPTSCANPLSFPLPLSLFMLALGCGGMDRRSRPGSSENTLCLMDLSPGLAHSPSPSAPPPQQTAHSPLW